MTSLSSPFAAAVRAATHRALEARERLAAGYPLWENWRRQVWAAKAEMVAHWRDYLATLREQVEAWGGKFFFAPDAASARNYILQVARRHGVGRISQSKSMTAHEIGLAPFLSRQGIRLTETDLGEFFIQLAGHPPAHLTAPALHLNRFQIASLLSHRLQRQAPSEPAALTRLAATHLADCYQKADLGITGVNFAAAREGVLVCLENEGNLRQCASWPPVHLALMGWDKMLPGLAELEPCLRLLPASATGQRLTALVHFFKGLKSRAGNTQAFYLVVIDNGRSRLAEHPELREALHCLRCGACLNICPVFQVRAAHLYGRVYPGAIGALLAPFLPPRGDISHFCTQCGACGPLCPAGIELPKKIRYLRQTAPSFRRTHTLTQAAGLLLGHPRLYRALEVPWHSWWAGPGQNRARRFFGLEVPAASFWRRHRQRLHPTAARPPRAEKKAASPQWGNNLSENHVISGASLKQGPSCPPRPSTGGEQPPCDFPNPWQEAGVEVISLAGTKALARHLAATAQGEVHLQDHPWLMPVVSELEALGVKATIVQKDDAPETDTAVMVGLGMVPEMGAVVVEGGSGPAFWLPFRARRQVILLPAQEKALDLAEALKLVKKQPAPMITLLAGPTRTADIEKLLVLGAQGPAALSVILYQPEIS